MGGTRGAGEIAEGTPVVDASGQAVGTVVEATPSYVVVEQGAAADLYVPIDVIASIGDDAVTLRVSRDEVAAESYETAPPVGFGFASTDDYPPGILFGGHLEDLGTTDEDVSEGAANAGGELEEGDEAPADEDAGDETSTAD